MRRLILMRHAEAVASSPDGDHGRPLSDRGHLEARAVGRALADRGARPDHALVSSARRAQETWEGLSAAFGDVILEVARDLYDADSHALRQRIEAVEDDCGTLVLVGHNPAVHRLAVDLMIDQAAAPSGMDALAGGFPPATAVVFSVDSMGRLTFDGMVRPEDLA